MFSPKVLSLSITYPAALSERPTDESSFRPHWWLLSHSSLNNNFLLVLCSSYLSPICKTSYPNISSMKVLGLSRQVFLCVEFRPATYRQLPKRLRLPSFASLRYLIVRPFGSNNSSQHSVLRDSQSKIKVFWKLAPYGLIDRYQSARLPDITSQKTRSGSRTVQPVRRYRAPSV
jgi:hypothetical protein